MNTDKLTQKSAEVLRTAQGLSAQYGNQQLEQVHLLLSLLQNPEELTTSILQNAGIDTEGVRAEALKELEKLPKVAVGGTPAEAVYVSSSLNRALSKAEQRTKFEELLAEFHITHVRTRKGTELSGGERRRVEIARCLALEPQFILLDEPFAGVDPLAVADIQEIIQYLRQRGMGILITDHNVRETLQIVDRAYILSEGKILLEGDTQTIAESPIARKFYLGENFTL